MKKKNIKLTSILKRELKIIYQRHKSYLYLLILIETLCSGFLPFLTIWIPKNIINSIIEHQNYNNILNMSIFLFGLSLLLTILSLFCNSQFDGAFVELRMLELKDLHKKYQDIEYSYLEDAAFLNRAEAARQALSNPIGFEGVYRNFIRLCPCIITILIYLILLCSFQPWIALITFLSTYCSISINQMLTDYMEQNRAALVKAERQKEYFHSISYDVSYGKEIRIFSLMKKLKQEYEKKSNQFLKISHNIAKKEFYLGIKESSLIFIKNSIVFLFLIKGYFNHSLNLGEVSFYMGMILSLSEILEKITDLFTEWMKCFVYADGYFQFIDEISLTDGYGTRQAISNKETLEIEFQDVSFRYSETEPWVLRHFNLKIKKGEKLAIVGVNGAGKSTIIKLLTGLFSVTEGKIFINKIDTREFQREEYAKMFSTVYQEVRIYAATILENIIGDAEKKEKDFAIKCLEAVGLKEIIEALPLQYDTPLQKIIEEQGIELSGGQNQRIAIARALYKNSNMIILDEPTAALDAIAESKLYETLNQLVGEKTAIYISHRLSSTMFCDHIMVFSKNGILEYGNHKTLMEKKGVYFEMFETQGQYYRKDTKNE